MKLTDYVLDRLVEAGARHVFLLTGGGAMHLNNSLGRQPKMSYVCMLHEQGAAIAAEAYTRTSGALGVAMVTSGPGGSNAVTGVAGAWLDSTPCVFLSGQVKRADLKQGSGLRQLGSQELDIVEIVKSITKYAVTITDPATVRFHVEKALHLATTGRPGPVWLDFPLDIQALRIEPAELESFVPPELPAPSVALDERVDELLQLLGRAERPVFVVGNGIRVAGALDIWARVLERVGIPVLTTWLALDLIADDHTLFAGRPGGIAPRGANFTIQNCDLMISVGARLDAAFTGYAHDRLARHAKKVMVDIDPAEISKMRTKIDVRIEADAGDFLRCLERKLGPRPAQVSSWIARVQGWKKKYPVVLDQHREGSGPISVYHLSDVLSDQLQDGEIVVTGSSGTAVELFLLAFRSKTGQRIFHNRGLGAMGFGIPSAIAACFASDRRRVISVDGDGGFQMNAQELAVVARYQLPIVFFVVNNDGYASIRNSQDGYFKLRVGADPTSGLTLADLEKLAAAYGVPYCRIAERQHLSDEVAKVLAQRGPMICEIMAPSDEVRAPRLTSVQREDGSMVTKPLEDLWPFLPREELRENMLVPLIEE